MKQFFIKFFDRFRIPSEQERLHAYLSQATDRAHLEYLEKEYWNSTKDRGSNFYVALHK